jgi:type II secretory pathway pseudopilin PulG
VTINQLVTFLFSHLEIVVIGLVLLSTVFNLLTGGGRAAQQKAQREAEAERQRAALERARQQSSTPPVRQGQASQAELKDLQAEIFAALGMKGQGTANPDPQVELRRQLAQKMGRAPAANTAPASTAPAKSVPPKNTPRPPPRAASKPIESQIEVYLETSRQETLERDTTPNTLGYSQRQQAQRLPSEPSAAANYSARAVDPGGNIALINKPDDVNAVRGIGTSPRASGRSFASSLVDPRNAAQGIIWAEILGKPRSRR